MLDLVSSYTKQQASSITIPKEILKELQEVFQADKKYFGISLGSNTPKRIWDYKKFIDEYNELCREIKDIRVHKGDIWCRVIFDEADSIGISNCLDSRAYFTWFITSSIKNLIYPNGFEENNISVSGLHHNGYIKNTQTGVVLNVNHAEIEQAKEIIEDIGMQDSFSALMRLASSKVNSYKFPKKMHTKKNDHLVREDLHTTLKIVYEKTKNGWAGVIGKFRIVTKEHVKMIEYALDKYKGASVMIVSGKRNDGLIQENIKIMKKIFEGKPVEFFAAPTGNAITLERKTRNPIVAYVCGPDREKDYQSQLDNANYDSIVDVYDAGQRGMVSATNAEKALRANNKATLRKIIHPVAYEHLEDWSRFYLDSE